MRVLLAEVLSQSLEPMREDLRIGVGIDGQPSPRVPEEERAVRELELELLRLEDATILIRKDGEEDLVSKLGLRRGPVHIEDGGPRRAWTILEHVQPPRIRVPGYPHVIGHEVEDDAEVVSAEGLGHAIEGGRAPDLRIEGIVIRHVVAVRAARAALEARRQVGLAHPERRQVGSEGGHLVEAEGGPELESVGGASRTPEGGDRVIVETARSEERRVG